MSFLMVSAMRKCKFCGVPLEGFLGKIAKIFFGVAPSKDNPQICNKCEEKKQPA
jgi:hypothetical protein